MFPDSPAADQDGPSARLVAQERPGDNALALSVSELSADLKRTVEDRFGHVRVRGELSGFKRAASGHLYLCLKDESAVLDAVMWKGQAARLAFRPEDGIEVIATGRITTFPGRSKYQIVIDTLELAGEGALMLLFERVKARLAEEGLFAAERKRPLPFLPRVIGVVTSPTGAVIRDILHRLADRFPSHVLVWPVLVQGEAAAGQVSAAIRGFDALQSGGPIPRPDLVIVARGGGSIEDLWAFNEEVVVRAVADCAIPIISAVGHETDRTLCDYVADRRAPTPTAAAEIAVPVRAELLAGVRDDGVRITRSVDRVRDRASERFEALRHRMPSLDRLLAPQRQRLDDLGERLGRGLAQRLALASERHTRVDARFTPTLLSRLVRRDADRLTGLARVLASLDPTRLLAKGYAMVHDGDGRLVTSAAKALTTPRLSLRFADGATEVAPVGKGPARSAPRARGTPVGQNDFFD